MGPVVIDEPWGLHVGRPMAVEGRDGAVLRVSGIGQPRLIVPAESAGPRHGTRRTPLPPTSFPFAWGGARYQAYELPTNHHRPNPDRHTFTTSLGLDGQTVELTQTNVVGRGESERESEASRRVSEWINWQIHCFQELGQSQVECNRLDGPAGPGVVRRSWDAVRSVWVHADQAEARMALIVQLARDRGLNFTLESISRHPRRVLERVRQLTRLDRIEQLDAACIRDYARRPGVTTTEKAGSRQELLSVQRQENRHTLENRVTCWVLDAIADLASEYSSTNRTFSKSEKLKDVRRFHSAAVAWRHGQELVEVSGYHLEHPVRPNYPLQFDQRYRRVYAGYQAIREEQKVSDDAWQWQRVLWGETGRQLLACALTQPPFQQRYTSAAYIRNEGICGRWTHPPLSPGPFGTPAGECVSIDAWDVCGDPTWGEATRFPGAIYVGSTGCDQVLWWPASKRAALVWHHYWTGDQADLQALLPRCAESIERLVADIMRYERTTIAICGLIICPELECSASETLAWPSLSKPDVAAVTLPPSWRVCAQDLGAALASLNNWN